MATINISSSEPVTVIVNGKTADFGPSAPPSVPSGRVQPVPAVTTMPPPYTDVGAGNQDPRAATPEAGRAIGVQFTIVEGSKDRNLRFFGDPGQFWSYNSWAIFNMGGTRLMGADNATVTGTLGTQIPPEMMMTLAPGTYVLGFALDAAGRVASQFVQG